MNRKEVIREAISKTLRGSKKPMTCTDLYPQVPVAYDHNEVARELSRMHEQGQLIRLPAGAGYKRIRFAYMLPDPAQQLLPITETAAPEQEAAPGRPRIRVRGNPEAMTITDQGTAVVIALPGFEVTVEAL